MEIELRATYIDGKLEYWTAARKKENGLLAYPYGRGPTEKAALKSLKQQLKDSELNNNSKVIKVDW